MPTKPSALLIRETATQAHEARLNRYGWTEDEEGAQFKIMPSDVPDLYYVRRTKRGFRSVASDPERPLSMQDARSLALALALGDVRVASVSSDVPLQQKTEASSGGLSLEEAKAHLDKSHIDRPLGLSWAKLEAMQGGRIRGAAADKQPS